MDITVDERSTRLYAGDMAVIFPHHSHSFAMLSEPEGSGEAFTVLVINPHLAGDYAEQIFSVAPALPFLRKEQLAPAIPDTVQQLLHYSQLLYPERYHPTIAKSYTQLLLAWLWPLLDVCPSAKATLHSTTYKAIQYMRQHFRESMTLESVAAALGISKRQLSRVFSDTIHIGFHEYLLDLRTEHAKKLLRDTQIPITDIAYQAGFESQRTFNRAFRDFHGMTPREYRKSLASPAS